MRKLYSVYLIGTAIGSNIAASENVNDTMTNTTCAHTKVVESPKSCQNCDSCSWKGFEIGADFLWWQSSFSDIPYAKDSPSISTIISPDKITVNTKSFAKYLDAKWEPGVRIRVAKEDLWRDLDLIANYVFIEGASSGHTNLAPTPNSALETTTLANVFSFTNSSYRYSYISNKFKYKYQTFDVLFGTSHCFKKYYKIKPFVGVTGVFFKEKISYFAIGNLSAVGETSANWSIKTDYTGIGLKVGTDFGWRFWDGLSLDGMCAAVVAPGSYESTHLVNTNIPGITYPNFDANFFDDFDSPVTGWQIALGFLYEKCISSCKLDLHLRYEMIGWHNLPSPPGRFIIYDSLTTTNSYVGPLGGIVMAFQGITAGFDVHF